MVFKKIFVDIKNIQFFKKEKNLFGTKILKMFFSFFSSKNSQKVLKMAKNKVFLKFMFELLCF